MNAPVSVLVVDDDATVRSLLQKMLEKEDYRVCVARDGLEALASLESSPVDIVISDICMPKMGGLDLIREIRKRQLNTQVLLMTGDDSDRNADMAFEAGADSYIGKPFKHAEIASALQSLLKVGRRQTADRLVEIQST